MRINTRFSRALTVALIALLFFGTLMPGSWKNAATPSLASPVDLAMMAHVMLFAAICFMLPLARFWRVLPWHVPLFGLALALLTEGLQFFAIDRHPSLGGVYQDMLGSVLGWAIGLRFIAAAPEPPAGAPAHPVGPASAASIRAPGSPPTGR